MSIQSKIKGLTLQNVISFISAVFLVVKQIQSIKDGSASLELVTKADNLKPDFDAAVEEV